MQTEPLSEFTARSAVARSKMVRFLAPVPLLCLMMFWMWGPAATQSPGIDEVPHVGAGLSYWHRQDLRLNGEHPPLAKLVAAAPLAMSGARADYDSILWTASQRFHIANFAQWAYGEWVLGKWNPRQPTVFLARLPMLALTLLLGVIIYLCALRLGGIAGGLLCLSLYVSTPAILAFGPLVLTDIPAVLFSLLAVMAFARAQARPGRTSVALFALALAAALLTKFSCGLLLIAFAICARRSAPRLRILLWGTAGASALIYLTYFVLSWNQPVDLRISNATIARLLMPIWLYARGVAIVLLQSSRPVYLLGETLPHGVFWYFPLLLLWKSTPGFLGLLLAGAGFGIHQSRRRMKDAADPFWRTLSITCAVFTAASLAMKLNLGYRHFLPALVLLILLLAPLPRMVARSVPHPVSTVAAVVMVALCASSLLSAAIAYPKFLPYMNEWTTRGTPAWRLVGDSNVDWNQALPDVARFAEQNHVEQILVDTFGLSDPVSDIPQASLWDCQNPAPEQAGRWAAVSANALQESHNCAWLVPHLRDSLAGGSMYTALLPSPIPPAGAPGGPPRPQDQRRLFHLPVDLRALVVEVTRNPSALPEALNRLDAAFQSP